MPELFPTALRMRGSGFCNTVGRLFTILTPQIGMLLYNVWGVAGVLSYTSGLLLLQIVVVSAIGIETKGRSLEETGTPA
jgi:putative MFS transporter